MSLSEVRLLFGESVQTLSESQIYREVAGGTGSLNSGSSFDATVGSANICKLSYALNDAQSLVRQPRLLPILQRSSIVFPTFFSFVSFVIQSSNFA